jgi:uncharacterized membrane protein YGL010W
MKTLAQQMAIYNAYHQDARNKATHFVSVPLIIFALMIPLSWPSFAIGGGMSITLAMLFVGVVSAYYVTLDVPLGLLTVAFVLPLLWAGHAVAATGPSTAWTIFGIAFVGGWILQLIGHAFEGRRPALVDNFFQIFVAPVFLVAEMLFALGARLDLKREVESLTAR